MLKTHDLGPAPEVPSYHAWDPTLRARLHHGDAAVTAVLAVVGERSRPVAIDIETGGLGPRAFTLRCVTAAWDTAEGTHSVILDPRRRGHADAVRALTSWAGMLLLHNAGFDWPVLYQYELVTLEDTAKVWDTVVAARMASPDPRDPKTLEALATRADLLSMVDTDATMATAFSAAGYRTQAEGFQSMDVDQPVYRLGAMADTVATLRLGPAILTAVVKHLTNSPYKSVPPESPLANLPTVDEEHALALLEREQTVHRVMLRRSAVGILVDQDYLQRHTSEHMEALEEARGVIKAKGLDPDAGNLGKKVVEWLEAKGQLPANWPRTATGALKADKKAMEGLADVPAARDLAAAQRRVADLSKVSGYLEKVADFAAITGRVHPQVGVLGASATGRMSYREPELQQFSADARPILIPDPGRSWVSLDWSSIEPVVVANAAGDTEFLRGFNDHGADLYAPIVEHAGVERKTAKVVLLAAMYGQGRALLASNLGVSEDEARDVQDRVFQAMPRTKVFLDQLRLEANHRGSTATADGRLLPVPKDPTGQVMGYKATNYFTQGTAYSVLSSTIATLEAQGLGDAIILAMHDELVVDAEAEEQVRRVMETPPAWLESFTGHRVVLRTDSNPLPGHWAYV